MTAGTIDYLKDVKVYGGGTGSFAVTRYTEDDIPYFKKHFELWTKTRESCYEIGGRAPNLCDGFTEGLFCLHTGSVRYLSLTPEQRKKKEYKGFTEKIRKKDGTRETASLDTYNEESQEAEQIKSSIIDRDCSSFGPTSKQDIVYFMHFYNDGKPLDGSFDLYKISNELLYNAVIRKDGTTFKQDQETGRRPHLGLIEQVILPNNIKPIEENVKLW